MASKILGISIGTAVGVAVLVFGGWWLYKNGCAKGINFICTLNQKHQATVPHSPVPRVLAQRQNAKAHAQAIANAPKKSVVSNTVSRFSGAFDTPTWAMAN